MWPTEIKPQILKNKALRRASLESEALEILNWQEFLWALKVICWKRTYSIWFYIFLPKLHLSSKIQLFPKTWTSPLNRPLSLEEKRQCLHPTRSWARWHECFLQEVETKQRQKTMKLAEVKKASLGTLLLSLKIMALVETMSWDD